MNSGAAGWPEHWRFYRSTDQVTSARHQSHRVRRFPPESNFPPVSNFLPGSKRPLDESCYSPPPKRRSVTSEHNFDYFIEPGRFRELASSAEHFGKRYDGRLHGRYAAYVKDYAISCKRPLNHHEQRRLTPCLLAFIPPEHWSWRSLTTVVHSFTSAGLFTPQPSTDINNTQALLLTGLLDALLHKCQQSPGAGGIDTTGVVNLLWSVAKLVGNGHELTLKMQETVTVLLPHVIAAHASLSFKDLSIVLWSMAKLVDNGQSLSAELQETVATLLPCVMAVIDRFTAWAIANLVWAMAKLVDNGQELTPELQGLVVALLLRARVLKDQLAVQGLVNLLWSTAKLVDNGQTLTAEIKETVTALLPHVLALVDQFIAQGIVNLFWAAVKLLDNGQELTIQFRGVLGALLPRVKVLQDQFTAQGTANLLWAVVKLMSTVYGLTPAVKEAVTVLLPRVNALKDQFLDQHIVNLLWSMAKLLDIGQALTSELQETVATLLPRINALIDQFTAQGIANLLWAVAKLLDNGHELTAGLKDVVPALLLRVNPLLEHFNPVEITTLMWVMGTLGDLINAEASNSVAESMLGKHLNFNQLELIVSLWGALVCGARYYLQKKTSNNNLECLIKELFARLEKDFIDQEQDRPVMALAASWLGKKCPFEPHYSTENSSTQSSFCAQLRCALPSLIIEQEKSIHSLPPVDLLLPEHNIAIEIQGTSHYIGHDFQTRNGSTLLKTALLQKAGYDVVEIPVNQLDSTDWIETYIAQIKRKTT